MNVDTYGCILMLLGTHIGCIKYKHIPYSKKLHINEITNYETTI